MDGGGTQLHIAEVIIVPSLPTNRSVLALLDADLVDAPEMYDRLYIAPPWEHQAGGLETIRIHMQWTSRVPAVDRDK